MMRGRLAAIVLAVSFALMVGMLLAACRGGSDDKGAGTVKPVDGDTVSVHYRGTLDNGEVFDEDTGREPLSFVVGQHQVIDGFDAAVRTLSVGQKTTTRLEPAQAYGERRGDLVIDVPRNRAPEGVKLGDKVQLSNGTPAVVVDLTAENVRIDANPPLAGKALTFEIELLSIKHGSPAPGK